jgi:hypothetical protein
MKKNILYKAFMALLAMTMCVSFAACGDDDDDDETISPEGTDSNQEESSVLTAKVTYSVELDDIYYGYFNVTVSYVSGADSTVVTEVVTENKTISFDVPWKADLAARLVATFEPKFDNPVIDPQLATIDLNGTLGATISLYDSKNQPVGDEGDMVTKITNHYTNQDTADLLKYLSKSHTYSVSAKAE